MYTVERVGQRTIINIQPETKSRSKKMRRMEAAYQYLAEGITSLITIAAAFNAYSNPNPSNITAAFGFAAATAYLFDLGRKSKFGEPLFLQTVTLDGNDISVKTNFLGLEEAERYHAQFVELDIHDSEETGISGILLKYGNRYTPLMLPAHNNETTEVFNLISAHIKHQRQLAQSRPLPPQ